MARSVRRRARFALVATPVLGLVASLVAVSLPSPEQRAEVRAADVVAARYEKDLDAATSRFSSQVTTIVRDNTDDFGRALALVQKRTRSVPRIPEKGTSAYGREHSDRYQEARSRRDLALRPYLRLVRTLRSAVTIQEFIEAGTRTIRINPTKLLSDVVVVDGSPLREIVVPRYRAARKDLKKHPAPPGSEVLGRDLDRYVKDAITSAEEGADDIDAGRPFFFDFGRRPQDLQRRLVSLQSTLATQVLQVLDETTSPGSD